MKPDEQRLMRHILAGGATYDFAEMHVNRLCGVLDKWDRKGWWEYGTAIRAGWLTTDGRAALVKACGPLMVPGDKVAK